MMAKLLSIGGITIALEGGESLRRVMLLPGFSEFVVDGPSADAYIRLDAEHTSAPCRLLHRFDIADGTAECRFGVDAEGAYNYDFGGGRWLRFDPQRSHAIEITTVVDPSVIRFALWSAYSMLGLVRGRVPVHSSTVVCDGRAVMCLGESGTGKSTHTRLWLENIGGTHLLNDDSPILAVEDEEVVVYGSPWSGKTHCYRQERRPVAAFLRLEQKPYNKIERLGVLQSFAALQPSCPPCLAREEHCMDRLVHFISDVIERSAVYRMGCLPDADAARMSHDTIIGPVQ